MRIGPYSHTESTALTRVLNVCAAEQVHPIHAAHLPDEVLLKWHNVGKKGIELLRAWAKNQPQEIIIKATATSLVVLVLSEWSLHLRIDGTTYCALPVRGDSDSQLEAQAEDLLRAFSAGMSASQHIPY